MQDITMRDTIDKITNAVESSEDKEMYYKIETMQGSKTLRCILVEDYDARQKELSSQSTEDSTEKKSIWQRMLGN